jgi:HAD superfamily hydrolase (TIGR01509 family)
MIKAVFWDNDGVLVDTEELYFRASREVLATIGIELTPELFIQISLKEGRSVFDLAAAQGQNSEDIAGLQTKRNRRYSELLREGVRVLDGVENALQRLHGKVQMGIVTTSLKAHFDIIHTTTNLLPFFDFVLTREDYGKAKPNPEPFLTAVAQNGFRSDECLIVEDSARGFAAAQAAGIKCIMVPNRLTNHDNFSGAYRIVSNATEVADAVLELIGGSPPRDTAVRGNH